MYFYFIHHLLCPFYHPSRHNNLSPFNFTFFYIVTIIINITIIIIITNCLSPLGTVHVQMAVRLCTGTQETY